MFVSYLCHAIGEYSNAGMFQETDRVEVETGDGR